MNLKKNYEKIFMMIINEEDRQVATEVFLEVFVQLLQCVMCDKNNILNSV